MTTQPAAFNPWAIAEIQLIDRDHPRYAEACLAWNLHAQLTPHAVVTARTVHQVQAAVRIAAAIRRRVVPFTTGHLAPSLPDVSEAILLRTELCAGASDIVVDPVAKTARIPAGAVWEDVVQAVAPHGLAVAHGSSPDVGVVGYLLGGGLSFYARQHGLAVNAVTAFEVVGADGILRRATADEHPDLFWALRGGGGNFGVVVSVEIGLLPYAEVYAGAVFWPVADADVLLRAWHDWTLTAPETVTTSARILRLPPIPAVPEPLQGVAVFCVDGVATDEADGRALIDRLTALRTPMLGGWEIVGSGAALRIHGDPEDPIPGVSGHTLLGELDAAAIDAFLEIAGADAVDSPLVIAELRQLGGALERSPEGCGARGALDGRFALFALGVPMGPGMAEAIAGTCDLLLGALAPWDTGRRYLNFDERGRDAAGAYTPESYRRLCDLRLELDPHGTFVASHAIG